MQNTVIDKVHLRQTLDSADNTQQADFNYITYRDKKLQRLLKTGVFDADL